MDGREPGRCGDDRYQGDQAAAVPEMIGRAGSSDREAAPTLSTQQGSSGEAAGPAGPRAVALPARYEDLGLIGSGAFGDVHRVRDTLLDRVLAMKVLRAGHTESTAIRRRFTTEAQIAAQLQHPGIVTAYDRGELGDGRLWFTMREIRGRTLRDVIDDMHAASSPAGFGAASAGWTFRRLVDAFARIAQAVAYVHSRGVVHRDLKPANLMIGEFGEVVVMDWGVARRIGHAESRDEGGAPPSNTRSPKATQIGAVVGTPAYMPPEQAAGDSALHGPASDIYSLGAVLYSLLTGRPPYVGRGPDVIRQILAGPPVPLREAALGGPPVPAELASISERAMRRDIAERHANAEALAAEVLTWLDGARRRDQALAIIDQARSLEPEIARARAGAEAAEAKARSLLAALRSFDPIDAKRPGWLLEDEAKGLLRSAALVETSWLELLHGALTVDPDLPEAHVRLADHYRQCLITAEAAHRDEDSARFAALLEAHDRGGRYAAFLRGEGRLSLATDPPGAEVALLRHAARDRRLVADEPVQLGQTPFDRIPVPRGDHLLILRAPGRAETRYPIVIERDGSWDGQPPGASSDETSCPVVLAKEGELGPDDCYVPAGWCWIGGDEVTSDSLPRRRIWVDGFILRRFPVTNAEYLAFLNDLVSSGREAEALAASPRSQLGRAASAEEHLALRRDGAGLFTLRPASADPPWDPGAPVVLVDWYAATAYAGWLAARTGQPWRLPNEIEREKASRGVDGRLQPWGNHVDATFACVLDGFEGEPRQERVSGHPFDESPYGVRGLAGNVRDWCINVWRHEGPLVEDGRLRLDPAAPGDPDFRVIKGGAWASTMIHSRAAARFGARPGVCRPVVGIRVARSWPG